MMQNIPTNAISGATVMRVSMQYDNNNINPCGSFDFGEVEDYTVVILRIGDRIPSMTNITDGALKVYPNPAKEFINVDLGSIIKDIDDHKKVDVSVFSIDGKLLINKTKPNEDMIKVDVQNLPYNKFYFIKISVDGITQFSTKFLKL